MKTMNYSEEIDSDNPGNYNLIFDQKCREVKSNLYLPPADNYSLVLICETKKNGSQFNKNDILINLEHNFSFIANPIDKVITNNNNVPLSYLNFNNPNEVLNNDDNFYLKLNTGKYRDEYKKIEYITKNPNRDDTNNPFLVKNNIEPLEPGRYYKYVNVIIFKVLIDFRKNMFNERYSVEQNNRYTNLVSELNLFLSNYLLERNDDRVLKNPSNRYTRLEKEIDRLTSLPSTQENVTLIGFKQKELDNLRAVELNEKQPFGPYKEKIENLKNIYNQIIKDYNGTNDQMKQFLKSNLNQSGNPSFESLMENI